MREESSINSRGQNMTLPVICFQVTVMGKYAARRAELRRKAGEEARARERQAAAPSHQDEAEESDATEEEATRESTTRRGRPRGGTKVAARIGERLRREIGRGGRPRVGDG